MGSVLGFVANHFDVVPVRTNDEGCKVIRVVVRAQTRRTIVFGTRLQSRPIESLDLLFVAGEGIEDQLMMWILRAVLSVPGHAMWTGMMGAMAARKRFDGRGLGLLGGYLLAVSFHGAYDLSLFAQQPLNLEGHAMLARVMLLVPIVLTVAAFFVLRSMARTALRLDDADAARAAARAVAPW